MLDLDAYLERIGHPGKLGLADLHRAHSTAIPFENLDPHRGVPVSLAVEDLERKMVAERRGGYCFEQNLLLKAALESLGAEVNAMLARVRRGAEPGVIRPRSHLVLRVSAEGTSWLADVGFGTGSLLEPVPFEPDGVHEQAGWRFRLVRDGPELVLQVADEETWTDLYGFIPQPVPLVDIEMSNWFTSTHPRSPFVTGLIASQRSNDGALTVLSDWSELALTVQTPAESTVTTVGRDAIPELLASRFALPGFELDEGGRLTLANR